ncbi:FliM/FliN family flagellar motor switch protein [Cedecea sp. FDAARGOS_727]|uniref:FliM/FliN family flagellar motor switch protein n=1 Tax=Cedecea sp. FDAARGOS_727 TaxID=2545798 RepID=UPI00143E6F16|nr:FliM/FliN family flagellar motor switch protein [Cedecea sp. FDAARGOS_727]QIX94547.1 protein HrcQ [Cedecea sp. FDAARGOS_727]
MKRLAFSPQPLQEAQLRRWIGSGRRLPFFCAGEHGELRLLPSTLAAQKPGQAEAFSCAAGTLLFGAPLPVLGLMADCPALPGEPSPESGWYWSYFSQQLSPQLVELLEYLRPATGAEAELVDITLRLEITLGEEQAHSPVSLSWNTLQRLAQHPAWQRFVIPLSPDLPLRLPLTVGRLQLSCGRARGLAAGDLLLPKETFFAPDGQGVLPLARRQFQVQLEPAAQTAHRDLLHITFSEELTMTYPNAPLEYDEQRDGDVVPGAEWQTTRGSFDDLSLELTIRCGNLQLTLGELQQLDAGSTVLVQHVTPGEALLCHGNNLLAKGELVDVNGTLGFQITRMLRNTGAALEPV